MAASVAALLQRSAGDAGVAEFRGIAFRGPQLVLNFGRPWWDDHPRRLWRLLGASLSEGFSQTLTFGTAVERVDCSVTLAGFGPGWLDQAFAFETRPDR
jgi:hypothetical protein